MTPPRLMHFTKVDRQTASSFSQGALMLMGDYGGHTWLICQASRVRAADQVIEQLATDLGARFTCSAPHMNAVWWVLSDYWDEWRGDMQAGQFIPSLWISPLLMKQGVSAESAYALLSGNAGPPLIREA